MVQKLKKWWVAILGIALVVLDMGFDAVNPILADAGITGKWLSIIKVVFGIYGIYRLYKIQPQTPNLFADDGPGGSNDPKPDPDDK